MKVGSLLKIISPKLFLHGLSLSGLEYLGLVVYVIKLVFGPSRIVY